MKKFVRFFFLLLFFNLTILSSGSKDSTQECKKTSSKSPLFRLKKHVLCNVDPEERPSPGGKNATEINLVLMPKLSRFDEATGKLKLHSNLYMEWSDERFKWDPAMFENITEMEVSPREIWTPEVTHQAAGIIDPKKGVYNFVQCYLTAKSNTTIIQASCIVETVNYIECDTDFSKWPYDHQNCTLILASWAHSGEEFTIRKKALVFAAYAGDPEWSISVGRVIQEQKPSMYLTDTDTVTIVIDIMLDRTTNCFRGHVISPAIIVMVMTIVTSYLEPLSMERFAVACLCIVVHMLCIMNVNWAIPHNGNTVPNILLFYCNSLVLATIALLLTFVLKKIETKTTSPPRWITSYIVRILKNRIGQVLLLSIFEIGDPRPAAKVEATVESTVDESGALVSSDSSSKKLVWRYVSILILSISYYVFILTYFIMFIVLILTATIRPPVEPVEQMIN